MKKYINRNFLWADAFVTQLEILGVSHVCISPGSRSTPLSLAFAQNKSFQKYVFVDERSSGFFALGLAKQSKNTVAIVTTSGTAVAELYPAIIEAFFQRIPLIICSADRPASLRNTGANQTINQNDIFRNHIRGFFDTGLPSISKNDIKSFCKNIVELFNVGKEVDPGPIHINFPFKKPLEPNSFTDKITLDLNKLVKEVYIRKNSGDSKNYINRVIKDLSNAERPVIHLVWDEYDNAFNNYLIKFANTNSIPILVDGTSDLRYLKGPNKNIICNHTAFINHLYEDPDLIIQFGNAPTSQLVLKYIEKTNAKRILVNKYGDLKDPSERKGELCKVDPTSLLNSLNDHKFNSRIWDNWTKQIIKIDTICEKNKIIISKSAFGNEPRIVNEILNLIPNNSNLFISNSLPIRDFDYFGSKVKKGIKVYTNRGASGIDGIISTAMGIANQSNKQTFLVIGDLAFYHNISSLSVLDEYQIPLKIILINNNGGGIFNSLPIADKTNEFLQYFITKKNINFKKVIVAFNGKYYSSGSWSTFKRNFVNMLNIKKYSVLEVKTDSKSSVELRKKYWKKVEHSIKSYNDSTFK